MLHSSLVDKVTSIKMNPTWCTMVGFDKKLPISFDGAFVNGSIISWVARNNRYYSYHSNLYIVNLEGLRIVKVG